MGTPRPLSGQKKAKKCRKFMKNYQNLLKLVKNDLNIEIKNVQRSYFSALMIYLSRSQQNLTISSGQETFHFKHYAKPEKKTNFAKNCPKICPFSAICESINIRKVIKLTDFDKTNYMSSSNSVSVVHKFFYLPEFLVQNTRCKMYFTPSYSLFLTILT